MRDVFSSLSMKDRESVKERLLNSRVRGVSKELKILALEWGCGEELLKEIEDDRDYVRNVLRKLDKKMVTDGVLPIIYEKLVEGVKEGSIPHIKELLRRLEKENSEAARGGGKETPLPEVPKNDNGLDEDAIALRIEEIAKG